MWWKTTTLSPAANWETPAPTAATSPEVSWPKMRGAECDPVAIFLRSVPQTPQVWTRSRISPAPILGTGTVSRRTSLTPRYTAACIVVGINRVWLLTAVRSAIAIGDKYGFRTLVRCTAPPFASYSTPRANLFLYGIRHSGIRIGELYRNRHRIHIRRIGRREVKRLHLHRDVKAIDFDDPPRGDGNGSELAGIEPPEHIFRIRRWLLRRLQDVFIERVVQID